jgi:raffinose/stachyose/melibiose transport system substrate-binding protein
MKKFGFFAGSVLSLAALAGCGGSQASTLYVLQNKPEIDTAMKEFGELFAEEKGVDVKITSCGGDLCQLGTQLQADIAAGEAPDIFVIDGIPAYEQYKDMILDLSNEVWVDDTDVAFSYDGKVFGFPVAIEGWGMAFNKDLIDEYNALPNTVDIVIDDLNTYGAYQTAFAALDAKKADLGIDSVVSMAGGAAGMSWVTNDHNFNSLLSAGLEYGDLSVVEDLLEGNVAPHADRLNQYSNWVNLLFQYADQNVLKTGGYDQQVGAFANEKAVFLHQGNWVEPFLANAGATFERGFAPHGALTTKTDGIFVAAPSWYVVNKQATPARQQLALDFLEYMATTPEGHDYMVNGAGNIPAFKSVELSPTAPLSVSVQEWAAEGKIYSWSQYYFDGAFRYDTLGPIYTARINGIGSTTTGITAQVFLTQLRTALESYPEFLENK